MKRTLQEIQKKLKQMARGDARFYRDLVRIAVPIALQNLITAGVNALDTVMVGRLGAAELAAVRLLGIRDLALPPSELARLDLPEIRSALIVENKASFTNLELFLSTPVMCGAVAIFGSGYAAGLAAPPWLGSRRVAYWGDIDSHGLRILAELRRRLPAARSVMMDEATFERFRPFRSDAPHDLAPAHEGLSPEELALFLRLAALNAANRLEQERIPQAYASAALAEALG